MYFLVSITVTIIYRVVEFLHITGTLTKGMKVVENNPFISLKTNEKCINFNSIIYLSINSIPINDIKKPPCPNLQPPNKYKYMYF